MKNITVIGGDLRQLTLAKLLSDDGYNVGILGFGKNSVSDNYTVLNDLSEIENSDVIILPMPASVDMINVNTPLNDKAISFKDIAEHIGNAKLILGGKMHDDICKIFPDIQCIDYYEREDLIIKNALPTAEGAIEIAMGELPVTINKCVCLVVGYGRIGKILSKLLAGMGAVVYVSARKYSDLAWIDVNGYNAVHNNDLAEAVGKADVIFNTVPAMLLDENILKRVSTNCVVIDLASKPGGVDFEKAGDLGLNVIWALSLPGRVAPITSGEIIKDTVVNILSEGEV